MVVLILDISSSWFPFSVFISLIASTFIVVFVTSPSTLRTIPTIPFESGHINVVIIVLGYGLRDEILVEVNLIPKVVLKFPTGHYIRHVGIEHAVLNTCVEAANLARFIHTRVSISLDSIENLEMFVQCQNVGFKVLAALISMVYLFK